MLTTINSLAFLFIMFILIVVVFTVGMLIYGTVLKIYESLRNLPEEDYYE